MNTNKEIIIDGVNVAKSTKQGETQAGITCGTPERIRFGNEYIYKYALCKDNPNCIYKQLHHKIQECDILENKYINLETDVINSLNRNILQYWCCDEDKECPSDSNIIPFMDYVISNYIDNVSLTIDNLEEENEKLKQECEELKEELKDMTVRKIEYLDESLKHQIECDRYRQALKKIEEIVKNASKIHHSIATNISANAIIDIINEVNSK